jgi:hypothetical protein
VTLEWGDVFDLRYAVNGIEVAAADDSTLDAGPEVPHVHGGSGEPAALDDLAHDLIVVPIGL